MKKSAEVALGLVTGIGGFLEIGSIATTAQAGAEFGVQLAWVLLVGTVGLAFLMEMSGRLAAVSRRTFVDQLRERFGIRFFVAPLAAMLIVSLLVIASEIGGICLALELATGFGIRWWALAVALAGWLLLWRGTLEVVEQGPAVIGLVALAFLVAASRGVRGSHSRAVRRDRAARVRKRLRRAGVPDLITRRVRVSWR